MQKGFGYLIRSLEMWIKIMFEEPSYTDKYNKQKNYNIHHDNGEVQQVDKRIFELIKKNDNRKLPKFYELANFIKTYDKKFLEFYSFILMNHHLSSSQLFQDLFVLYVLKGKKNGSFLEFGATDGLSLSNSKLLEENFGWKGVLAEPSPPWHDQLRKNRPSTQIITDCIFSSSGKNLDFFVSDHGVLSTIQEYRNSSGHADNLDRNNGGTLVKVPTISLNDVFVKYFDSKPIDYMSVDTEGSELTILKSFDFEKFGPKLMTVEHCEIPDYQEQINALLLKNDYQCAFKGYSQFDGWYIRNS